MTLDKFIINVAVKSSVSFLFSRMGLDYVSSLQWLETLNLSPNLSNPISISLLCSEIHLDVTLKIFGCSVSPDGSLVVPFVEAQLASSLIEVGSCHFFIQLY